MTKSINNNKILISSSILLIAIDQVSKALAYSLLSETDVIKILPNILQLNYTINYGAAFSIFTNLPSLLKYISLFSSLIFIALLSFNFIRRKAERLAIAFLLAGSCGNGIDRWLNGYVVDFIQFKLFNFPIFNIADIYINIGILVLIIDIFKRRSNKNSSVFYSNKSTINK